MLPIRLPYLSPHDHSVINAGGSAAPSYLMAKKPTDLRRDLESSMTWIRDNLDATNHDVPDKLLAEWLVDPEEENPGPTGFGMSVFLYGYLQREMREDDLPASARRKIGLDQLMSLYDAWQLKLSLVFIQRQTPLSSTPVPLFHFPAHEELKFFTREEA